MKNDFNVFLLNDSFPPTIDGVANTVMNYANYINKNHGTPTVITPFYPNVVDNYPYEVIRYPSLNTQKFVGYRLGVPADDAIFHKALQTNPDIIHSHCPFVSTMISRALQRRTNAPIVFTYHTKFDIDIQKLIHSSILQESAIKLIVDNINACDEVWVVSQGAGENLRSLGYEKDFIVMQNGVDFPKGKSEKEKIEKVIDKYKLRSDAVKFIFTGRMMWYKGIDIILKSLKEIDSLGYDFQMIFVGMGLDLDEIKAMAKDLEIMNKCLFTGAITDREELRALYSASDLFLFPSTFDTNGLVVREAAACELPSILITDSCAAEGIVDGETGFLIDKTPEAMSAKIEYLLNHPEVMNKVGKNAQNNIYLSWEDAIAVANERYHKIIENYKPKSFDSKEQWTDKFYNLMDQMYEIRSRLHYET